MAASLLITAVIIFLSVLSNKISSKVGIPTLLLFIFLGMIFGSEGPGGIYFHSYEIAENICVTALIFIMFYGGFGTNWKTARVVLKESLLLSTLGVVITAIITGVMCHYLLNFSLWESILLGSIIASTDAASVFSILRSKNLGIRENVAPVLELESGSNDMISYMCMLVVAMFIKGDVSTPVIFKTFFLQLVVGALSGFLIAKATILFLRRFTFDTDGFDKVFFISIALFSYALPAYFGGNGFLSSYIVGIILGNQRFREKKSIVTFFDGVTDLMQLTIFFMLGLLSSPSKILSIHKEIIVVFIIISFIARPLFVFLQYKFANASFHKKVLVSFCGLRGAASIVFATMLLASGMEVGFDMFHIVFGVVLLSITLQGAFVPYVTRKLGMIDENIDVLKTFSDYVEDIPVDYVRLKLDQDHEWIGKEIKDIHLPHDLLIVSILRNRVPILPKGDTLLEAGDVMVLSAVRFRNKMELNLREKTVTKTSSFFGKRIQDIVLSNALIILLLRNNKPIIPYGDTEILENDVLIFNEINAR